MELFEGISLYDWVPFFNGVCKSIDEIGKNKGTRDAILKNKAKKIFELNHAINKSNQIDPFSFIYALAQKNTINQRETIYSKAISEFDLGIEVPEEHYFPTPPSNSQVLFSYENRYITKDGIPVSNDVLWKLFHQAVSGENLIKEDFDMVLSLKGIRITKLSQALFLINPKKYWSVDNVMFWLPIFSELEVDSMKSDIEEKGLNEYLLILAKVSKSFPGCYFYEINLLCDILMGDYPELKLSGKYCQISSKIEGGDGKDYFDEFIKDNAVWPGDNGNHLGGYELDKVSEGDIVLVRRGIRNLGGIGLIIDNEYKKSGYSPDKAIYIIWLNKESRKLNYGLGDWKGFTANASNDTYNKFYGKYMDTLDLINQLIAKQSNLPYHHQVDDSNSNKNTNMEFSALNTILYGPPGTGKTYKILDLIKSTEVNQRFENVEPDYEIFVNDYHWWELVSFVLLDKKKATVPEIMEHELIKTKFRISNIQHPPQRIWSTLQTHTALDCPNVKFNVEKRHGEAVFYKEADSVWRLNNESDFKIQFPFLIQAFENLYKTNAGQKIKKHYSFTTCHQSLSYEDFIEGIKPVLADFSIDEEEKPIQYAIRKGYFQIACEKAAQRAGYFNLQEALNDTRENRAVKFSEAKKNDQIYILFLDEINRCNISAVFGELITLIEDDKRLGAKNEISDTLLPYSQTIFGVPANLYIIGTMNTADRSVEALDTALRRRFSFEFVGPNEKLVNEDIEGIKLREIFIQINARITFLLDNDHQIGHSYFMGIEKIDDLKDIFKNKIIPLLKEYFYNDYRKIHLILGDGFVKKENFKPKFAVNDNEEMARDIYSINEMDNDFNIADALNKIVGK